MLNVIIIENEAINRTLLRKLVSDYIEDISLVVECTNIVEAYNEITKYDSVVVLLDIELGNENGLDLISLLKDRNDSIIVVSAFPEYAIEAFRLDVVDFVPKPIRITELIGAFDRVKKKMSNGKKTNRESDKSIGIQLFNKTTFVDSENIVLIRSDLSGTRIFLNSGMSINSIERIGQIEARLDKLIFARVDKSNIINLSFVKNHSINDGQLLLETNHETLIVSRRKKTAVMDQLSRYSK